MPEYERGGGCWGVAWKFARVAKWKQRANQRSKGRHGKGLKLNTQREEEKTGGSRRRRRRRGDLGARGEERDLSRLSRHKLWTQCSKRLGSIRPHLRSCPDDRNSSRTFVRGDRLFRKPPAPWQLAATVIGLPANGSLHLHTCCHLPL